MHCSQELESWEISLGRANEIQIEDENLRLPIFELYDGWKPYRHKLCRETRTVDLYCEPLRPIPPDRNTFATPNRLNKIACFLWSWQDSNLWPRRCERRVLTNWTTRPYFALSPMCPLCPISPLCDSRSSAYTNSGVFLYDSTISSTAHENFCEDRLLDNQWMKPKERGLAEYLQAQNKNNLMGFR